MKQRIRLTESDLHRIVNESVHRILNEEGFKQVDNLGDYISQNGLQMRPASKFQRVNAQSGKSYINQYGKENGMDKRQIGRMVRRGGAPLTTVAGDGTQETNNMVTKNHTVLNNVGNANNRWAAETPTFRRKYEQDPANKGVYKPKGGPMNAAQINEPISFTAPWGERMNIDKGGYILQDPNNPNDVYGISGKDFDSTYRFNESKQLKSYISRIIRESVNKVVRARVLNESYDSYEYDNVEDSDIERFDGNYTEVTVPDYCLPYLVNGDMDSYDDDELQAMEEFEREWEGKLANGMNIGDICIPLDGRDPSFTASNDVFGNLGCDCYRFLVPLR